MQADARLIRQDAHPIPDDRDEIRLFCKFRNEAARLPYFLSYHRDLGVKRFFLVDNASSDDSADVLRDQEDCHVFWTDGKMNEARSGMGWLEPLMRTYGTGQWCLVADADELFIYPEAETVSLGAFCRRLEQRGANALICMMIDMYPEGNVEEVDYRRGQPFLEVCPYFDRGGYLYRTKRVQGEVPEIVGGPQLRAFFPELLDRRIRTRIKRRLLNEIAYAPLLRNTRLNNLKPPIPAPLHKVPLVKWDNAMSFNAAAHVLFSGTFAKSRGALLHFKFLGDFTRRVDEEMIRRVYGSNSERYRRYSARLEGQNVPLNLMCDLSTRYQDTSQLLSLGLLKV